MDEAGETPNKADAAKTGDAYARAVGKRVDRDLFVAVGILLTLSGGFSVFVWSRSEAIAQAQGKVTEEKVERVAADLRQHKSDSGEIHLQLERDLYEVQLDSRALYRSWRDDSRSLRLEAPPTISPTLFPDGGQ